MADSYTCAGCGEQVTEPPDTACPKCGSKERRVSVAATSLVSMRATASAVATSQVYMQAMASAVATGQIEVVTYPQNLLNFAKDLIAQQQFSIAVVVAYMACEIATERSFAAAIAAKGLQHIESSIRASLNGYSLNNHRNRRWYTSLTGDSIQKQAFWQDFTTFAKRRNKIMHGGILVNKLEADESYKAASSLVAHLKK
jgi:hypothetical protein